MPAFGELTTLYLRGMPRDLVREAKAAAAQRGRTLASLVSGALALALKPGASLGPDESRAFDDDRAWFERNRARIARKHPGEFVAVMARDLVDHDRDFGSLAERVFAKWGSRPVFMPRVEPAPKPLRLRSPRLRRP